VCDGSGPSLGTAYQTGYTRWWHTTTLAEEYGVVQTDETDLYAAMDWLLERQEFIEKSSLLDTCPRVRSRCTT